MVTLTNEQVEFIVAVVEDVLAEVEFGDSFLPEELMEGLEAVLDTVLNGGVNVGG